MEKIYLYSFNADKPVYGIGSYFGLFNSFLTLDNKDADELLEIQKQNPEFILNLLTNYRYRLPTANYQDIVENMDSSEIEEYKKLSIKVANLYASAINYMNENKTPKKLCNATGCKDFLEFENEQYNSYLLCKKYKKDIEKSFSSSLLSLLMFNVDLISVGKEAFDLSEAYKIITKAYNLNNNQITELLDFHENEINRFLNLQCVITYRKGQNIDFRPYMQQLKNNLLESEENLDK